MNVYVKYFDKNSKYIYFVVNDEKILKKYNEIWNKIKKLFEKQFNSEPVHKDKYMKAKIKIYNNKVYKNL